ncbi:MAG: hypothetical protein FJ087_23435, partial [Deltaproteobacteria bacterium]|nr:hypothetical protein [Deltaproteobacteria bacterium]
PQACAAAAGWVADSTDCDDVRAAVHPGAAEACNGLDDDCDGGVDEGVLSTFRRDADGDGFGNAAVTTQACSVPVGYVADATDCDDTRASVHPGAAEVCYNAIDDDCNGTVDQPCALRSCAEVHANNPTAPSGSYTLDPDGPGPKTAVAVECDMAFDGGGWTRVGASVRVWGTGWDGTAWNSAGFSYSEVLVRHVSGSVHAHCTYPEGLPGCVNLGFQIPAVRSGWGGPMNWGSSTCGMGVFTWTNTTFFAGTYHFKFGVGATTAGTIQTGTLEGISNCTTGDNPGEARLDLWVR